MNYSDGVQSKSARNQKYYMERKNLLAPFEKQEKYAFYFNDRSKRVMLVNGHAKIGGRREMMQSKERNLTFKDVMNMNCLIEIGRENSSFM